MDIPTDADLIACIESFLDKHQMPPSRFGREAMGDGALLQQIRAGRSLSLRNAAKVFRFMASYRSSTFQAEAA